MDATRDTTDFTALVRRHIGWVHGVARRRLNDAHLAEDVTQAVFILLHRKAPAFASERSLVAWLHRTACFASEAAARTRKRRQRHETEAAVQRAHAPTDTTTTQEWRELAPLLDSLIERLGREDREAILLRFYRQMTFAEVAAAMGSTEEAVRKRVTRAIEKLRSNAAARGITMTSAALVAGLDIEAAVAATAPAGLVAASTSAALAQGAGASALTAASLPIAASATTLMTLAKLKIAASILIVLSLAGGGTALVSAAIRPKTRQVPAAQPAAKELGAEYAKLAPFDGIRWNGDSPEVRIRDNWVKFIAINDIKAPAIVQFAKANYGDLWQKRIGEDLVEVLTKMGRAPGDTVKLNLTTLDGRGTFEMSAAPMTEENRSRIWDAQQRGEIDYPKLAPFNAIRWNGEKPEVRMDELWLELLAIDHRPMPTIVAFAKKTYGARWQKRIGEDLVQVISEMGGVPRATVHLQVRTLDTGVTSDLADVPMTEANRRLVWDANQGSR